jgi:HAMP domain-containing protein
MLATGLAALSLLAALWAVRSARHVGGDGVRRALAVFGAGAVLLRLLLEAGTAPRAAPLHGVALALAAPVALATWTALAWLAGCAPRRRDLFLRAPFAALAALLAFGGAGAAPVAAFVVVAASAYRWRHGLPTPRLLRLTLAALALAAVLAWRVTPASGPEAAPPALAALRGLAEWVRLAALFHAAVAVPVLLLEFLRDPSLGIRTVGRRLAVSHALVVLVPLLLTLALWTLTTWLGVGAERALVAVRHLESEGETLEHALAGALDAGAHAHAPLAALAASGAWPAARAWVREGGGWARVHGAPVPAEGTLAAWADSAWASRASGVVELSGRRWFGATAHARADSTRRAVLLAPLDSVLAGRATRVVGARLSMGSRVSIGAGGLAFQAPDSAALAAAVAVLLDSARARGEAAGAPESLRLARSLAALDALGVRDTTTRPRRGRPFVLGGDTLYGSASLDARRRGGLSFVVGGDTLRGEAGTGLSAGMTGNALVLGVLLGDGGWRAQRFVLTVQVPFREALAGLWRGLAENPLGAVPLVILLLITAVVLFVAVFDLVMVRNMARSITAAIHGLRGGTAALAHGDLAHRIAIHGHDDLWDAARAFNHMADGLARARAIEKEAERLENELALARRIQARLLPAGPPAASGLEVAGLTEPAREVGGDYFDHLALGDGRVLLVIADVSGKGVGAALLMSAFRASLMSQDIVAEPPDVLAARLNDFLHRSVDPGKFVTAFLASLDGRTGRLVFANCGHNPPMLLRADGSHEMLSAGGLILGILPGGEFTSGTTTLGPGDLLLLYTDGVTEGVDASGAQWGEERLLGVLRARSRRPCAELVRGIAEEVRAFEGEQGPADDITLLAARRV